MGRIELEKGTRIDITKLRLKELVMEGNISDLAGRFCIRADGRLEWGDGVNPRDTFLERILPYRLLLGLELATKAKIIINVGRYCNPVDILPCSVANDTTPLRPSIGVDFFAAVWDSAVAKEKLQRFRLMHVPTALDKGEFKFQFVDTSGTVTGVLTINSDGEIYDGTGVLINEKLLRYDDTQISFTNTTASTIKSFRFYKRKWRNMRLIVSLWGDGTNTVYCEVYIDGSLVDSFSTTNASETFFERVIDISGLADGVHNVEIKMYVDAGTGYTQFLEAWVW